MSAAPKQRPTYGAALLWIALNDNDGDNESSKALESYLSVGLVADLFGKTSEQVARDVFDVRNGGINVSLYRVIMAALQSQGYSNAEARASITPAGLRVRS